MTFSLSASLPLTYSELVKGIRISPSFSSAVAFFAITPSFIERMHSRNLDWALRSFVWEVVRCSSSELRRVWRERSCGTESEAMSTLVRNGQGLAIGILANVQ